MNIHGARRVTTPALTLPSRPGVIQCYSPATLTFLGEVEITTPDEVRRAVAKCRALQPAWASTSFAERKRVLQMMKAVLLEQQDDIVRLSCMDTGKPRVDAIFGEVMSTLGKLDWLLGHGEAALAPETRTTNFTSIHKRARVEYVPLGVIGEAYDGTLDHRFLSMCSRRSMLHRSRGSDSRKYALIMTQCCVHLNAHAQASLLPGTTHSTTCTTTSPRLCSLGTASC